MKSFFSHKLYCLINANNLLFFLLYSYFITKETGGIPYTGSQAKIYYNISCMVSHDPDNRPDLREIIDVLSNIETNKMLLRDYHLEVQRLSARVKYLESLLSEKKIEFE